MQMHARFESPLSSPGWGASALLAVWILLWAFFTVAIVEPAARLHAERTAVTERT